MNKFLKLALAGAAAASTVAVVPTIADAGGGPPLRTYQITVENLAPAGSQPLSPVGTVVHHKQADVWTLGQPASAAVAAVAEDAGLPIFVDTYNQTPGVREALASPGGPIGPGASVNFEIEARPGDRLSLVSMLVNTNDAFTGLDAIGLPGGTQVYEVGAYDAGTEVNNENPAFIPGPVGGNPGVRDPEGNVITEHAGIVGVPGGIDPALYDWDDPVARITIERT
ncbi:MAG: spondin domain-containing protein [Ilumatobacteraceae bacterium]